MDIVQNQDFVKQEIEFTCPIHKKNCQYVNFNTNQSTDDQIFLCSYCVIRQKQAYPYFCLIDDIINIEENQVLDHWPLNNNFYLFNEINKNIENKLQQTQTFFKEFRASVIDKIDKIEELVQTKYQEINKNKQSLIIYYNSISFKDEIKNSVLAYSNDKVESIKQFKECINKAKRQTQDNQQNIELISNNYKFYNRYLCVENLKQFQKNVENVLQDLEKIVSYDIANLSQLDDKNNIVPIQKQSNFKGETYYGQLSRLCSLEQISENKKLDYIYYMNGYQRINEEQAKIKILTQQLFQSIK